MSEKGTQPDLASLAPLLVAVQSAGDSAVSLDPVAVMTDSGFAAPDEGEPGDSANVRFAALYFQHGQRFQLTAGGRSNGSASVDSTISIGCVGIAALATRRPAPPASLGEVRLGTTGSPAWSGPLSVRALSTDEARAVRTRLADTLLALGTAPRLVAAAGLSGAVYGAPGGDTLVLIAVLNTPDTDALGKVVSALVIAEVAGTGPMVRLVVVPDSLDSDVHSRALIDAFDVDRDGWPDLLIKDSYSESYGYVVYRRRGGRWSAWYRGGGGGC